MQKEGNEHVIGYEQIILESIIYSNLGHRTRI
jgi:hypothetical protein